MRGVCCCGGFHCMAQSPYCSGSSCCRAQAQGHWASVAAACGLNGCGSWALERTLNSCGQQGWVALKLVGSTWTRDWTPALVGEFFTTEPPVQFSRSVMSESLQPHELQYARLPCPSPTPRACSNSCPLSQWCHWTISSSVGPFSSCFQSFPASVSFPVSQFFASGCQSIGTSASVSVLPMNIQDGLRDSQESSPTPQFKSINSSVLSFLYGPALTPTHDYWKKPPEKPLMSFFFFLNEKKKKGT